MSDVGIILQLAELYYRKEAREIIVAGDDDDDDDEGDERTRPMIMIIMTG